MKRITSLFMLIAFFFSPLSSVFAELTRDEQVELLRAEITRVTGQLNAILEERVYEGYSLILKDRGESTQPLRIGDRGTQVIELQKLLTREGVYTGPTTGYYGPLTDAAVAAFEEKYKFYLDKHVISPAGKTVGDSSYNFSFEKGEVGVAPVVSVDTQSDIEFTRDVLRATYGDIDKYKQDIVITLKATDGVAYGEMALGIESVVDAEKEEVYMFIGGDVAYDLGFLASGEGEIEAEILLSREGMFVRAEETDLFPIPAEYSDYFGEWIGIEFDELSKLVDVESEQEFEDVLEEAFDQMFSPDAQVEAYDMFPFYAIDTSSQEQNTVLTRSEGEEVYTYDIRFDLNNFEDLTRALNESNEGLVDYQVSDLVEVAEIFGDALDSLELSVDVTESLKLLNLDLDFSQTERTDLGTTQIEVNVEMSNQFGQGTVPNAPRDYINLIDLFEELAELEEIDNPNISVFSTTDQVDNISVVLYEDYVLGDELADINIIAYIDQQCPFCKRFHDDVFTNLVEEYKNKEVGFVLRPFPLDKPFTNEIHQNATEYALGAECAGYLGDTDGYYDFIDEVFANDFVHSVRGADLENSLTLFANRAGVDSDEFRECYAEEDFEYIQNVFDAVSGEVQGTPSVYIQYGDDVYRTVPNYDMINSQLQQLL